MSGITAFFKVSCVVVTAAILAGCAARPDTIAANDEALCRYSEAAGIAGSYAECRRNLDRQRARVQTASVTRIEGYALLREPAVPRPTEIAVDCKPAKPGEECPADDTTGSISPAPKR